MKTEGIEMFRKIRRALRCRQWVYAEMKPFGDESRCRRPRGHFGVHENPDGDRWSGRRS